jgi:hypothetical protein
MLPIGSFTARRCKSIACFLEEIRDFWFAHCTSFNPANTRFGNSMSFRRWVIASRSFISSYQTHGGQFDVSIYQLDQFHAASSSGAVCGGFSLVVCESGFGIRHSPFSPTFFICFFDGSADNAQESAERISIVLLAEPHNLTHLGRSIAEDFSGQVFPDYYVTHRASVVVFGLLMKSSLVRTEPHRILAESKL